MFRYAAIYFGDLQEFSLTLLILALCSHLFCQVRVAVCQCDDRVSRNDFRLVEEYLLQVPRTGVIQP